MDTTAGPVGLRVVVHGRPRPAHDASLRHRRHLPGVPLSPGGHRACRRDPGRDVPRPLLARPWRRRSAQRARHRRGVAGVGSAPRCCSKRSRSSTSLFSGKVVSTTATTSRSSPPPLRCPGEDPIYVATAGPVNAKRTGGTPTGSSPSARPTRRSRCCGTGSRGRRRGRKDAEAMKTTPYPRQLGADPGRGVRNALEEWPNGAHAVPEADIKNPRTREHGEARAHREFREPALRPTSRAHPPTPTLRRHGFDEIYLHNFVAPRRRHRRLGTDVLPTCAWIRPGTPRNRPRPLPAGRSCRPRVRYRSLPLHALRGRRRRIGSTDRARW